MQLNLANTHAWVDDNQLNDVLVDYVEGRKIDQSCAEVEAQSFGFALRYSAERVLYVELVEDRVLEEWGQAFDQAWVGWGLVGWAFAINA